MEQAANAEKATRAQQELEAARLEVSYVLQGCGVITRFRCVSNLSTNMYPFGPSHLDMAR